jgi:hypothetical protein
MSSDSQSVRCGGEDDERAYEIGESCMTSKRDGSEGRGHESGEDGGLDWATEFSLTLEKNPENGVALSRASAHHVRPTVKNVPIKQGPRDRKMMNKSPNVAPVLPVAWM